MDGTNLWNADYDTQRIYKLDGTGQVISSFAFSYGSPRGVAYTNGVLFVATSTRVYRLTAESGAYISEFSSPDPTSPNHQGLAIGEGKLWIASLGASDDRIYGVDPATGLQIVSFAAPGSNPRGLTYYDGSLWNLDSSDNKLYRLSPANGAVLASYPIPLGNPRGLTYYNGRFIEADMNLDLLMSFDITNTFSDVYIAPSRYFSPGNSLWLPYISSHSLDQTNTAIRRILFFQHGVDDNAVEYFGSARYAARQAGRLDETLVVALQLLDDGKFRSAPPTNLIYWTSDRFWGSLSAGALAPYPRSERFSAFQLLDDLLSKLTTNAFLFPNLEEVVVSGHSGGGQFANRYAAASPFERTTLPQGRNISMHYVVMNPSSYVYFDAKRFDPTTLDLNAGVVDFVTPSSPSPGYNDYGYGLEHLDTYPASVGSNNMVAQYPGRKVIYLLGEADTLTDSDLDTSQAAMLQGTNRYERGLIYYGHLKDHFGATDLPRHRLATIPGVGHDSFAMITSVNGLRYHFLDTPPNITQQPKSLTVTHGSNAGFSVTATGTAPLNYQWRHNGAPISGATTNLYSLASVQSSNAGSYTVVTTNVAGSVTSQVAVLIVRVPPAIIIQPQSRTNVAGTTASFTAGATGTDPLSYQWRHDGTPISGATTNLYSLASVQSTNAGSYTVVATNVAGSATSLVAVLTVWVPPEITTQPQSQTNSADTTATFIVTATGTDPLSYQWRHNGTPISGATTNFCSLASVQSNNAGIYTVVVTNLCGTVTSAPASLVVWVGAVWLDVASFENVGRIRLRLHSEAGRACEMWSSTNLTDWVLLRTITNETGADVFSDTATNEFGGYYRLRQLP